MPKRLMAREWLIFLALFPLGFLSCFILGYYWTGFRFAYFSHAFLNDHEIFNSAATFDAFWNDIWGLTHFPTLCLWLVPYLALSLIRSVRWSIKILSRPAAGAPN
jgi:hypothetical protein